jgi:hypothetical protein
MDTVQLLGAGMGLGVLAGIRLYATILALGLGIRLGLLELNGQMSQLDVLASNPVLAVAGAAYVLEFFADKVPWVDSLWDSIHTFIRPVGAAYLGAAAVGSLDPATQVTMALLCGGAALSGHSMKAATRLLVNQSPEPFSNVAMSTAEDLLVPAGAWFAITYPTVTLGFALAFLAVSAWLSPKILRFLKLEWAALTALWRRPLYADTPVTVPAGLTIPPALLSRLEEAPEAYVDHLRAKMPGAVFNVGVKCAGAKGWRGLRHSIGYLCFGPDGALFITRRMFRFRTVAIPAEALRDAACRRGLLMDRISFRVAGKERSLYLFKTSEAREPAPVRQTA